MPRILPVYLVVAVLVLVVDRAPAGEWSLAETDHGVDVMLDGKLFTSYRTDLGPKPILWPVFGPTGKPLTRAYPMEDVPGEKQDHVHQRSLWFTHGEVNGVDFWSEQEGHGSIVQRTISTPIEGDNQVEIHSVNDWLGPDGKKHLEDERRLVFHSVGDGMAIDFEITLNATAGDVTFGDTKEGTMGIRVPTVMDVDSKQGGRIVNSEGQTDEGAWGKPAAWVDYHGPIDGEVVGVAILNHPTSFRYPTHWHVRTYGLFAANPFGLSDFQASEAVDGSHTISSGDSIALRYRFIFHKGDEKQAKIQESFEEYAKLRH